MSGAYSHVRKRLMRMATMFAANTIRNATSIPAIPSIDVWQQKMTSLGQQWCNPSEQMSFGYEPQIWYYDGGRTYFQIADYTGRPANWEPCALNIVGQYRDYVLSNNGALPGWRVFPRSEERRVGKESRS